MKAPMRRLTVNAELVNQTSDRPENLCFEDVKFTNCRKLNNLNFLSAFKNLSSLALRQAPNLNGVHHLKSILTKRQKTLTRLDLSGSVILDDSLLNKLSTIQLSLHHFIARHSTGGGGGFTDDGLNRYLRLPFNSNLRTLDLSGHADITDYPFLVGRGEDPISCILNLTTLGLRYTGVGNATLHNLIIWRDSLLKSRGNVQVPVLDSLEVHLSGQNPRQETNIRSLINSDIVINIHYYNQDLQRLYPGPDELE
jgi:hypothetical protein